MGLIGDQFRFWATSAERANSTDQAIMAASKGVTDGQSPLAGLADHQE